MLSMVSSLSIVSNVLYSVNYTANDIDLVMSVAINPIETMDTRLYGIQD